LVLGFVLLSKAPEPSAKSDGDAASGDSSGKVTSTGKGTGSLLTLRRLIGAPIRHERPEMSRTSPECANFQIALLGLSIDEIEFPPKIERMPSPAGCSPSSPRVAKMLRHFSEKCAGSFESIPKDRAQWEREFGECQVATILLRSTLAVDARPQRPLSEITDMRELADLLVAQFGEFFSGLNPGSARELAAIADRMAELDPNLVPAAKAGAIGSIIEVAAARDGKAADGQDARKPNWTELENRVRRIEELNPNDPELDRYRRIVDTELMTPELVKRDSLSRIGKNPKDASEYELLAWANWKLGRKDEARHALAQARALQPNHPSIQKNWAVVNRPNAKPEDFKIQIQLGMGFEELLK
jgi:hypothetical protein